MPKTISSSEAKAKLSALMAWVQEHQDEVIIESRGAPRVVLMPYSEYEKMKVLKEQARRAAALARLREVKARVSQRNQDLSEAQAHELADRFVRDVVDEMTAEGKLIFE